MHQRYTGGSATVPGRGSEPGRGPEDEPQGIWGLAPVTPGCPYRGIETGQSRSDCYRETTVGNPAGL